MPQITKEKKLEIDIEILEREVRELQVKNHDQDKTIRLQEKQIRMMSWWMVAVGFYTLIVALKDFL